MLCQLNKMVVWSWVATAVVMLAPPALVHAQGTTTMGEVVVRAEEEKSDKVLPEVEGTKIYSGKKTSVINLEEAPININSNYRQALQKTPGLLLSEETTPLLSIGYRGLAPDRVQFTQVLKDGIPISADVIGYPESYYTPPLEAIDHIEFIRGGAGLMYGPQPGGALNYVTKEPYADGPLAVTLENTAGSYGLYSNYTGLSGMQGPLGYLGYFHHRQAQGFRANNSQYDVFSGGAKLKLKESDSSSWTLGFDSYEEEHGEPGGLTRAAFDSDPTSSTRLNDHFELNRYAGVLAYENEIDPLTSIQFKTFGGYYERLSFRQKTSGSAFGTVPNGTTNDIQDQEFMTGGAETRVLHNYSAFGSEDNALSVGVLYYHGTSPRVDKLGLTVDAEDGTVQKDSDRSVNYTSVFLENLFKFNKLSVTPGVRLENIWQAVQENKNVDKTTVPLADQSDYNFVPLFGIGAEYELNPNLDLYSNVSQGYRPKIYTQAVPTGSGQVVNEDLEEGKSWQADVGLRGTPLPYFYWDSSVFYMQFADQIGTSGSSVENVGDARHYGAELLGEFDIVKFLDTLSQTDNQEKLGSLNVFANVMLLSAKFFDGPNENLTPQYAPDFIFRTGVEYDYHDKHKITLAGTFVDDHYANDTNTSAFQVPSYKVWDLTTEFSVYKDIVDVFGGVNNIFDEKYFSRVRSDGIDPAPGRNYYAGVKFSW